MQVKGQPAPAASLSKRNIAICTIALLGLGIGAMLWKNRAVDRPAIAFERLTLVRGPCFGSCPIYSVTIERDGHVTYTPDPLGERAGDTPLVRHGKMPKPVLEALIAAVESQQYANLDADYSLNVTDMPSTTIEVHGNGSLARTRVYAVPCRKDATKVSMYRKMRRDSPPVPDIFCTVEELADEGSCARYWGQTTRPFMTPDVPTVPTPERCR